MTREFTCLKDDESPAKDGFHGIDELGLAYQSARSGNTKTDTAEVENVDVQYNRVVITYQNDLNAKRRLTLYSHGSTLEYEHTTYSYRQLNKQYTDVTVRMEKGNG